MQGKVPRLGARTPNGDSHPENAPKLNETGHRPMVPPGSDPKYSLCTIETKPKMC